MNLYAYCHNNPVGYVDPSGHDACPAHESAVAELKKNGVDGDSAEKLYDNFRKQGLSPEEVDSTLKNWNKYIDSIEEKTGRKLSDTQRSKLIEEMSKNSHARKLTEAEYAKHRGENWSKNKKDMIKEWEKHYKEKWPTYGPGEVESSGYKTHKEGYKYDAHEIIPNVYGGPMEWWNLVPAANGNQHQGGIHGVGAPIYIFFPEC